MTKHPVYRLLVVDDESDLREVIHEQLSELDQSELLEGSELEISQAGSAKQALKLMETRHFDAVLSDVKMPDETGIEMLAEIRSFGWDVPVMFLTAFGEKKQAVEALRMGAFDFLDKPWDPEVLKTTVAKALLLGAQLRDLESEIEERLKEEAVKSGPLSSERRRQLRMIHRSLLLLARAETEPKKAG